MASKCLSNAINMSQGTADPVIHGPTTYPLDHNTSIYVIDGPNIVISYMYELQGNLLNRGVQGEPQQVDPTHFIFNIDNAADINHVIIFLTGATAFPEGTGAAVHFGQPSPSGLTWHNLGFISNEKPSVIFKISGLKNIQSTSNNFFMHAQQSNSQLPSTSAHIGIAVEPLAELKQQTPAANTQASNVESFVQFTQKMLENFYNYASSFSITQAQMTPQPSVQYLPADVLTKWYENFQRKLSQNPNFWKK